MDSINSINNSKNVSISLTSARTQEKPQRFIDDPQNDSFEKNSKTNKIVKCGAIIAGIGLAILAFIKRKQICEFFSNLFKRKSNNSSTSSNRSNLPSPDGSTPPPAVPSAGESSLNPVKPNNIDASGIPQASTAIGKMLNTGSCDEIAKTVEKLQIDDIQLLVKEITSASKETQNNLLDVYKSLEKKHTTLLETDPKTIFERNNLQKLLDEIKARPEYANCNDPIKISEAAKTEMIQLLQKEGLSNLQPETELLGKKLYQLNKQMTEQNISFVPEVPKAFSSEAEKIKYIQSALIRANTNEASAMDALDVFEKYGSRYTYERGERIKYNDNGMSDLYRAVSSAIDKFDAPIADKVMSKYLDIFNKIARIDGNYRDTRFLERFMTHNADKMSEDTVIKLINTLKKYSFESNQAWYARAYFLKTEFSKRTPEELARIEAKIKELEETVKNMPKVDRTKPKGMSD